MLITASYPERGFAKLGSSNSKIAILIQELCAKHLPNIYEFETAANEVWMRSKERRTGKTIDYLEVLAEVDIRTNREAGWINKIDPYYNKWTESLENPSTPIELMRHIAGKPDYQQIYQSFLGLFLTKPCHRQSFLRDIYLPWFFNAYPDGKILALKISSSYEKRVTLLRWGNLLSIYNETEIVKIKQINPQRIKSMEGLHETGVVNFEVYLSAIANLFFPYPSVVVLDGFGYFFILFTNEKKMIDRGSYPSSRIQLHRKFNLMQGDLPNLIPSSDIKEGWYGRYKPAHIFNADELLNLFRDIIC